MSSFETRLCVQVAKEALAAADRIRDPELKRAVLGVWLRYASMAEIAANRPAMSREEGSKHAVK